MSRRGESLSKIVVVVFVLCLFFIFLFFLMRGESLSKFVVVLFTYHLRFVYLLSCICSFVDMFLVFFRFCLLVFLFLLCVASIEFVCCFLCIIIIIFFLLMFMRGGSISKTVVRYSCIVFTFFIYVLISLFGYLLAYLSMIDFIR